MLTVKGTLQNGVARPDEPLEGLDGRTVFITIVDEDEKPAEPPSPQPDRQERAPVRTDWDRLTKLIEECQVDTGIGDLAHQHDHYLYGTPKKPEP